VPWQGELADLGRPAGWSTRVDRPALTAGRGGDDWLIVQLRTGDQPLVNAVASVLVRRLVAAGQRLIEVWRLCWRPDLVLWSLVVAVLLLPLMMLSAVSNATVSQMKLQADEISTLASGIRAYYADNVIARLQAADGKAVYSENYRDVHGGIPIPATLSIELGALFDNAHSDGRISYNFVSEYPFAKRAAHPLDSFEIDAISAFRADPQRKVFTQLNGNGLGASSYRMATPVLMRKACVTCHNTHPDSPKRDWKVGDVRGIQEVTIRGLQVNGFGGLGLLMGYVGFLGLTSVAATSIFRGQTNQLAKVNQKLMESNRKDSILAAELVDQIRELSIFAHVVDKATFGIAIADMRKPDSPLIYVNDAFTTITGYRRELAIGFNCRFLQGPDTDPDELQKLRQAIRHGKPYGGELINYRVDGSRFWNRLTIYPIYGAHQDRPDYYVGNQVDISLLKQQAAPLSDALMTIKSDFERAKTALEQARRFSDGMRRYLDKNPSGVPEVEAFLIAEREAHHLLEGAITDLGEVLFKSTTSA
jgi:PAS domain S-box-containing protein